MVESGPSYALTEGQIHRYHPPSTNLRTHRRPPTKPNAHATKWAPQNGPNLTTSRQRHPVLRSHGSPFPDLIQFPLSPFAASRLRARFQSQVLRTHRRPQGFLPKSESGQNHTHPPRAIGSRSPTGAPALWSAELSSARSDQPPSTTKNPRADHGSGPLVPLRAFAASRETPAPALRTHRRPNTSPEP